MERIGNVDGTYQSHITAGLSVLALDRALVLNLIETEKPGHSEVQADFRMAWQLVGGLVTEITSSHHETTKMSHGGKPVSPESTRFASRRPISIAPDQLGFDLEAVPAKDDDSLCNGESYLTANASIMAMLRPLLKRYAHLDTSPEVPMSLLDENNN